MDIEIILKAIMELILKLDRITLPLIHDELCRLYPLTAYAGNQSAADIQRKRLQKITSDNFIAATMSALYPKALNRDMKTPKIKTDTPGSRGRRNSLITDRQQQITVNILRRIFDLVDVDSQGFISWVDLTNYCIRAANFAFRSSIIQATLTFKESETTSTACLLIRKLYNIVGLNFMLSCDSESSLIRVFKKKAGVSHQHGTIHPAADLAKKFRIAADREIVISSPTKLKARMKTKAVVKENLVTTISDKKVLCMTIIERRQILCLTTADRYLMAYKYRNSMEVRDGEYLPHHFTLSRYHFTDQPQHGLIYARGMDRLITWESETGSKRFHIWDVDNFMLLHELDIHESRILDVCEAHSPYDDSLVASSSIDRYVFVAAYHE